MLFEIVGLTKVACGLYLEVTIRHARECYIVLYEMVDPSKNHFGPYSATTTDR